jgi:hypothetical protein
MNRLFLIAFGILAANQVSAANQDVTIFEKESAKAANALYALLEGPGVVTQFGTRQLMLDSASNMVLTCNSQEERCTVSNPSFEQNFSSDFDTLLTVKGEAAQNLYRNLPSLRNAMGEYRENLGYSGRYGADYVHCSTTKAGKECEIYRTYCYQPGC